MDQRNRKTDQDLCNAIAQLDFVSPQPLQNAVFAKIAQAEAQRVVRRTQTILYGRVAAGITGGVAMIVGLLAILRHYYPTAMTLDLELNPQGDWQAWGELGQQIVGLLSGIVHSPILFFAIPMLFLLLIDGAIRSIVRKHTVHAPSRP